MKHTLWILTVLVLLVSSVSAHAVAISVNYNHAGLTLIKIENGQLHYIWHTLRKRDKPLPVRQDMSSYDRHEVHIWLTDSEINAIVQWIKNRKVFDLPASYPVRAQKTYGSAFQTTLSVTFEDQKHSIGWNGDSVISEELRDTESELIQLCEKIRNDRGK